MSDELSLITERLRQDRTTRQADVDASRAQQRTDAPRRDGTYIAGDRVFDTLTGHAGIVLSVTQTGSSLGHAVRVTLETGVIVLRVPRELALRPPSPAAAPKDRP